MAKVKKMLKEDCDISVKVITTRNLQASSVLERMHQMIGNMIRTFRLSENENIDEDDLFAGIYSLCSSVCHQSNSMTMLLRRSLMMSCPIRSCCYRCPVGRFSRDKCNLFPSTRRIGRPRWML